MNEDEKKGALLLFLVLQNRNYINMQLVIMANIINRIINLRKE